LVTFRVVGPSLHHNIISYCGTEIHSTEITKTEIPSLNQNFTFNITTGNCTYLWKLAMPFFSKFLINYDVSSTSLCMINNATYISAR